MSALMPTLRRGPWRYLRDRDVLHAAAITLSLLVLSLGSLWLGYFIHSWRVAARSAVRAPSGRPLLVFGLRLRDDDRPEREYLQRLRRAQRLSRESPASELLLLGGRCGGRRSEAAVGYEWLRQRGLSSSIQVRLEQASTDSLENLRHARALLRDPDGTLPPVALITSRWHMARCLLLARRLGFDAVPVAAEPRFRLDMRQLRRLLMESGYLMWIDIGMRWAALIGHRRMMARLR